MTFLENFAEDEIITSIADSNLEHIESDIYRFEVPSDPIIRADIPNKNFGLDLMREFFELNLYNRSSNQLVKSIVVPFSEGYLYIRDTEEQNIIRLGLTMWAGDPLTKEERAETFIEKYLSDVPFGEYNVIINFFADELGTYNTNEWRIERISNSRREILLQHAPTDPTIEFDGNRYQQFVANSIFVGDFDTLVRAIFQKGLNQEEFDRLVIDFFNRLVGREPELFENIDRSLFISGLKEMLSLIFEEIQNYVEEQIENKRFRIIDNEFDSNMKQIVFDIVSRKIGELPEGRTLFLAD